MNNAVIGLGSNVGDRIVNFKRAITAVSRLPNTNIVAISRVYETEPVGYEDQPDFLNANILIETGLSPNALLGACLGIESCLGRKREIKNGPRKIDLDILLYETVKMESFELTLPHPRILERAFVMKPLMDLFPSGRAPGLFFAPKLKEVGEDGVKLFDEIITFKDN